MRGRGLLQSARPTHESLSVRKWISSPTASLRASVCAPHHNSNSPGCAGCKSSSPPLLSQRGESSVMHWHKFRSWDSPSPHILRNLDPFQECVVCKHSKGRRVVLWVQCHFTPVFVLRAELVSAERCEVASYPTRHVRYDARSWASPIFQNQVELTLVMEYAMATLRRMAMNRSTRSLQVSVWNAKLTTSPSPSTLQPDAFEQRRDDFFLD